MGAPGGRCSCAPCWRGRAVAVLASFAALALFAALSGLSTAAPAQAQSGPGLADPPANVPRTQAMDLACGEAAGPPCQQAAVQAINQERAIEGVRPLSLPAGYNSLSTQRQLLVLADLERVDRGLPGFTGLSTRLDGLAEKGALSKSDPTGPLRATGVPTGLAASPLPSWPITTGCTTTGRVPPTSTAPAQ